MATTNNIGLYCFNTGEEDAKTSLEALFGAGNSNMKKIDDAIGELKKKSFIVNTEAELNALLTEENLGKTVSFNGALYIITEGGTSTNAPIAVGDTIDKIYIDTSKSAEEIYAEIQKIPFDENGLFVCFASEPFTSGEYVGIAKMPMEENKFIYLIGNGGFDNFIFVYSEDYTPTEADIGITEWGWQTTSPVATLETFTVATLNQQDLWSSYISKEPFTSGGGIIAKPVGAEGGSGLPSFAPEDAGKFLRVDSNGNIVAEAIAYAEGESF